jgi:hypothetical protein
MSAGTDECLLRVWERGLRANGPERALITLRELSAGLSEERSHALTLGERDRALFAARCRLFGDHFVANVPCPDCGQRLQFEFDVSDVLNGDAGVPAARITVETSDNCTIVIRVPNVDDLQCASNAADAVDARRQILERCVESALRGDMPMGMSEISETALEQIGMQLERADPDASLVIEAHCPGCNRSAEHDLDIAAFLWSEIEAESIRLLREVHKLARGYGWRESDILALSPLRRRAYIEMLPT